MAMGRLELERDDANRMTEKETQLRARSEGEAKAKIESLEKSLEKSTKDLESLRSSTLRNTSEFKQVFNQHRLATEREHTGEMEVLRERLAVASQELVALQGANEREKGLRLRIGELEGQLAATRQANELVTKSLSLMSPKRLDGTSEIVRPTAHQQPLHQLEYASSQESSEAMLLRTLTRFMSQQNSISHQQHDREQDREPARPKEEQQCQEEKKRHNPRG
eukprot:TRINITY_DN1231_c0_g1_i1.p1 TRINITY_DN1231_c0_g1~~TRINITY_DN1231_c0_g1_i1.p1  ORF type:complete len:222 (+),score=26.63 TRINITY_DN1231_c0_g1_i1:104-769(+)